MGGSTTEFDAQQHTASQEDMVTHRVPLGWRDHCSGLLIPLNRCRQKEMYLPWKCEDERHSYEKCQYDDMMDRMRKLNKKVLAEKQPEGY